MNFEEIFGENEENQENKLHNSCSYHQNTPAVNQCGICNTFICSMCIRRILSSDFNTLSSGKGRKIIYCPVCSYKSKARNFRIVAVLISALLITIFVFAYILPPIPVKTITIPTDEDLYYYTIGIIFLFIILTWGISVVFNQKSKNWIERKYSEK